MYLKLLKTNKIVLIIEVCILSLSYSKQFQDPVYESFVDEDRHGLNEKVRNNIVVKYHRLQVPHLSIGL